MIGQQQLRPWRVTRIRSPNGIALRPGCKQLSASHRLQKFIDRYEVESREAFARREEIVAACKLRPGMQIADIGAGTGLFTRLLSREVGPTGKVYAVDVDRSFVAHIEKTCKQQRITNVVGVVGSQTSLGLPPQSIDLAFICDTYHHFQFPDRAMASIYRALRPRGQLVLIDIQRIEGTSPERVLCHVRAGQEVFTQIASAGFKLAEEQKFLEDNYCIRFEKVGTSQRRMRRRRALTKS